MAYLPQYSMGDDPATAVGDAGKKVVAIGVVGLIAWFFLRKKGR